MELEAAFGTIDKRPPATTGPVSYSESTILPPSTLGYYYANDSHPPLAWNSFACNQVPGTIVHNAPCGTYTTSPSQASNPTVLLPSYPQGEQHCAAVLQPPAFPARPDQPGAIKGNGYDATGSYSTTTITSTWPSSPSNLGFQELQSHPWHGYPRPYVSHPRISPGLDASSPIFDPYTSSSEQVRLPSSYGHAELPSPRSPPGQKGGRPRSSVDTTVTNSGIKRLKHSNHANGGTQEFPTATQAIRPSKSVARVLSPRTESTQPTWPAAHQQICNKLRRPITPKSNSPPPKGTASNADPESTHEGNDDTIRHQISITPTNNDHIYPDDFENHSDHDSALDHPNTESSLFTTSLGVPTSSSSRATSNHSIHTTATSYTPYSGRSTKIGTAADQRERNRLAAYRCRLKTRAAAKRLEREEQSAAERRSQLEACVAQLRDEVYDLRSSLLLHADCDCVLIRQYLGNEARLAVLRSGGGEVMGEGGEAPSCDTAVVMSGV